MLDNGAIIRPVQEGEDESQEERKVIVARHRFQEGCLFKRGVRRKVWVGRWREDVIQADGSEGRMNRSVVLGLVSEIPTRRQAQALLEQRLRPLNQGLQQPQSVMLFRDYVEDEWSSLILPTLKLSTRRSYRSFLGKHIFPFFGERRLREISKMEVQRFVTEKFRQGLAWQTVRNAWIVLSSILDSAVEYGHLHLNPAKGAKFPAQSPRKEPEILTAEALARLLAHLQEPFKTMVALASLTGLRVGELLALRWRAVNLSSANLSIRESVYEGRFQMPKSERSIRTIPLGPLGLRLLEEHRDRSMRVQPDDLVFPNRRGKAYRESNLLKRILQPAGEAAGIGKVTWHQFRHIHSSILHDLGVPVKIAQQQLGHASVETTLNFYTHVIPETHRQAVQNLERVLFPSVPKLEDPVRGRELVIQ